MQIIIPMSGAGNRFRRAGYDLPKPLTRINGKPIIEYIIRMFPKESRFVFVCNNDHLSEPRYQMREILKEICPEGRLFGIPAHGLGPVKAILEVSKEIDMEDETIVNYCDFGWSWHWDAFVEYISRGNWDGIIPTYSGFHPHSSGSNRYCYVRAQNSHVLDIKEKESFTENPVIEDTSTGTYYFSSGRLMLEAFNWQVENELTVGGEYYVSLAYRYLLTRRLPVSIYPIKYFMQWGTPEDLEEYVYWQKLIRAVKRLKQPIHSKPLTTHSIMIMAGDGRRFSAEGYCPPKPLINVCGMPMFKLAARNLPASEQWTFAIRGDMDYSARLKSEIQTTYPSADIHELRNKTDGQATTALKVLQDKLGHDKTEKAERFIVAACDCYAIYDHEEYAKLIEDTEVDVIVWVINNYPKAQKNPNAYGWVRANPDGKILELSVKPENKPSNSESVIIGNFTFKNVEDYVSGYRALVARGGKINSEYYIDSVIEELVLLGKGCYVMAVDHLVPFGTPNELRTYEYWLNCDSEIPLESSDMPNSHL